MLLRFFHVCFNLFQYNMQRKLPNLQKNKSVPYSRYLFSDFILSSLTEKSVWKHLINLTLKRISDSVKYKQKSLITCLPFFSGNCVSVNRHRTCAKESQIPHYPTPKKMTAESKWRIYIRQTSGNKSQEHLQFVRQNWLKSSLSNAKIWLKWNVYPMKNTSWKETCRF